MKRNLNSIVFSPASRNGGVKSLYSVCEWLNDLGRSTILPFDNRNLASWFSHRCEAYDHSYTPDVLIYPEVYQPHFEGRIFHICFAVGMLSPIKPHADLAVCKSVEIFDWVKHQHPKMPATLTLPSINRPIFEYDGRPKKDIICYMTRPDKHPETAILLRDAYGDSVKEIVNLSEADVAETLKDAKVFVWRGHITEGSPRPPKEALVAGCIVVGLESELNERHHTNFGIRCSTVDELIKMAGESLKMPIPTEQARSLVRDSTEEKQDWLTLLKGLDLRVSSLRHASAFMDGNRHQAISELANAKQTIQSLSAEIAEKDQALNTVTTELGSKNSELERMKAAFEWSSTQLAERNEKVLALVEQVAERQGAVESLTTQLAERHEKVLTLVDLVAERQKAVNSVATDLSDNQNKVMALTAQAAVHEAELRKIRSMLGWRLLTLYGKIKYPYLLPIYRLLNLTGREPAANNKENSSPDPTVAQKTIVSSSTCLLPPMPIIVGCPRSGTTLLRFMLDSHPELAIPPETGFLGIGAGLEGRGDVLRKKFFREIVNFPNGISNWPDFELAEEHFWESLTRIEPFSIPEGYRAFYRLYAARFGKPRWGDKTPLHCMDLDTIRNVLPEARFIHIIRDGRDVALSLRKMWFSPGWEIETQAAYWQKCVLAARHAGVGRSDYLEVSYEDLVLRTRPTLERICSFIELDYDDDMLRYYTRAPERLKEHKGRSPPDGASLSRHHRLSQQRRTMEPPDPACVFTWRNTMSPEEKTRFQSVAGNLLRSLGYEA